MIDSNPRLIAACAATLMFATAAHAAPPSRHGGGPGPGKAWRHGSDHGGWRGHGGGLWRFWGGLGLGIGIGSAAYHLQPWGSPWYGGPVLSIAPPVVHYDAAPRPVPLVDSPVAAVLAPPDPVVYPRSGQSAGQTETDRRECNRWATTQPGAMADASVFHRATLACMDGRGYSVR